MIVGLVLVDSEEEEMYLRNDLRNKLLRQLGDHWHPNDPEYPHQELQEYRDTYNKELYDA